VDFSRNIFGASYRRTTFPVFDPLQRAFVEDIVISMTRTNESASKARLFFQCVSAGALMSAILPLGVQYLFEWDVQRRMRAYPEVARGFDTFSAQVAAVEAGPIRVLMTLVAFAVVGGVACFAGCRKQAPGIGFLVSRFSDIRTNERN
jgi:hypothetical protein